MVKSSRYPLVAAAACIAALLAASARGDLPAPPEPGSNAASADETPQREIFVPFEDLHVILSGDTQRVFVTREEYESLAAKAAKMLARTSRPSPQPF